MRIRYAAAGIAAIAALGAAAPAMAATVSSTPASVRANAFYAARTESAAYQQYYAYATAAESSGQTALADVWRTVGTVEYYDHWMGDTALAGKYQSTDSRTNLMVAISQAKQTAKADLAFAAAAPKGTNGAAAAKELRAVAAVETADAKLLQRALVGFVPSAPPVHTVSIQVSAAPHFSGAYYTDLTGGADSALSDAALNWGEYQYFARNAVNTGQAKLAQLLSGLEVQEMNQNWPAISNVAGYVNGNATNLRSSITSEEGAIQMYTKFANQAKEAADASAASMFIEVRGDEEGHHQTFTTELQTLTGK
jgi:rubrerythrin